VLSTCARFDVFAYDDAGGEPAALLLTVAAEVARQATQWEASKKWRFSEPLVFEARPSSSVARA